MNELFKSFKENVSGKEKREEFTKIAYGVGTIPLGVATLYGIPRTSVPYKLPAMLIGLNIVLGIIVLLSKKFGKKSKIVIESLLAIITLAYISVKLIYPVIKYGIEYGFGNVDLILEESYDEGKRYLLYSIIPLIGAICMIIQAIITKDKSNRVISIIWCLIFIIVFGLLIYLSAMFQGIIRIFII